MNGCMRARRLAAAKRRLRNLNDSSSRSVSLGTGSVVELKLPNRGLSNSRQKIETHPLRSDSREDVDFLVSNCLCFRNALPCAVYINLDCVLLHVLSLIQPLHRKCTIESDGMRKVHLEHR